MKKLFVFCFMIFSASFLWASDMVGALSAGMGGTGRAAVETNESLYLNPAGIALFDRFYTGVSYLSGYTGPNVSRNTYSVTMTDGTQGLLFPGSFSYRHHKVNDQGTSIAENEFRAGMGYRLNERLSIGLGASHLRAEMPDGLKKNQTNLDGGILIGIQPNWGLSVSGENLLQIDENTPEALKRVSRVAFGTQYVYEHSVTLRYELLRPLYIENQGRLGHRVGASFAMKGHFQLNGGYSVDDALGQNWASLGVAWMGPRLKLAYSLQNEARADLGNRHFIDLWMDI